MWEMLFEIEYNMVWVNLIILIIVFLLGLGLGYILGIDTTSKKG